MIEMKILSGLVFNEDFARKSIPYLKKEYFDTNDFKIIYSLIDEFFKKYNKLPTVDILKIELENLSINEKDYRSSLEIIGSLEPQNESVEWLKDQTEKFCKEKALHNALLEAIQIIDNKSDLNRSAIPDILSEALNITFDESIGIDYIADAEHSYEYYHMVEQKIKSSLSLINKITNGGVSRKTLNVVLAHTGGGKSMYMTHEAANNLLDGKNVLYITLEMGEFKIRERIDANLLDTNIKFLKEMPREVFLKKINKIKEKTTGRLIIKEYPTSTAHAGHFRYLLNELKQKQNFIPDVIYIDYLNLCASSRLKGGANTNSYFYVKAIAEELRGLAVEFDCAIWTATQVTRSGYGSSDIDLTDTSESFGLPATADLMIALIITEDLEQMNRICIKQLKNRYNDLNYYRKFLIGIDRSKMRFFDVDDDDDEPVFDKTTTGEKQNGDKFGKFNFE